MAQPDASATLAAVQRHYRATAQLTAKFRQRVTYATYGLAKASAGTLYVRKPSDVRWDYLEATATGTEVRKIFAYDGTTFWFVDRVDHKITQQQVAGSALPAAVAFLTGGDLSAQFHVAFDTSGAYGGAGATVLALTPVQPSAAYRRMFFVVAADGHVRESVVIASNGDVNDVELFAPDTRTPVAAALFSIAPASFPGYRVVHP